MFKCKKYSDVHEKFYSDFFPAQESGANFYAPTPVSLSNELVTVWDPELGRTNPSEHKQLKLARSLTRGIIDKDLKPSSNERK